MPDLIPTGYTGLLQGVKDRICVAEYTILPALPQELRVLLPEPEDIARIMEEL